jgi:4-oxalocrotonate tautomerase
MPVIQISMLSGRTPEKIEKLITELTAVTSEILDAPADSIKVLVTELEPTHYGSGGESIAVRRKRTGK